MKKLLFINILLIFCLKLYSNSIDFKGYPTKIQLNNDDSYFLMINDDYDFSFYSILIHDSELEFVQNTKMTKKYLKSENYFRFFTISIDNPVQREICSTDKPSFKKFLAVSIFAC